MDVVVAVVNLSCGVVGNENIDRGKRSQQLLNLRLLVEEMSACLFLDQEHPRRRWARVHIRYDR